MSCPACMLMMAGDRGVGGLGMDAEQAAFQEDIDTGVKYIPSPGYGPTGQPLVQDVIPGVPNKWLFVSAIGIGILFALATVKGK